MEGSLVMATVVAPLSRLLGWSEAIANTWSRRKHRREAHCPLCSTDLHRDIQGLIRQGFYQPAVAACRLRIELIVADYYRKAVSRLPDGTIKADARSVHYILLHLHAAGEINHRLRNRTDVFYKRSSKAVHGDFVCNRTIARQMANEAEAIVVAIRKGGAA